LRLLPGFCYESAMMRRVLVVGLGLVFMFPLTITAQGIIDFSGYYALGPKNGDHFGNWTRTGTVVVDASNGLRLDLEGPGSGSFTIVVPTPGQINAQYYTGVVGDGSITALGRAPGWPVVLTGDYISSTGLPVVQGDLYGWALQAGVNSHVSLEIVHFLVIPEPNGSVIFVFGALLLRFLTKKKARQNGSRACLHQQWVTCRN
jgi:hypothetical protein